MKGKAVNNADNVSEITREVNLFYFSIIRHNQLYAYTMRDRKGSSNIHN